MSIRIWNDEQLFQKARLINAALMAKIHTVEWTPGILATRRCKIGMHANWWGLAGEQIYQNLRPLQQSEVISGIPGSPVNHHAAPYSLTEEFVSVYRMHPLIPDDIDHPLALDGQAPQEPHVPRAVAFRNAATSSTTTSESRTCSTPSASRTPAR